MSLIIASTFKKTFIWESQVVSFFADVSKHVRIVKAMFIENEI